MTSQFSVEFRTQREPGHVKIKTEDKPSNVGLSITKLYDYQDPYRHGQHHVEEKYKLRVRTHGLGILYYDFVVLTFGKDGYNSDRHPHHHKVSANGETVFTVYGRGKVTLLMRGVANPTPGSAPGSAPGSVGGDVDYGMVVPDGDFY